MPVPNNKWFKCAVTPYPFNTLCPTAAILPSYIKNPTLFSGTTNNPGSLVTDAMVYAKRVNRSTFGQKRKTVILPVLKRVIRPLSNPIS
jgi:hypothetical protein